MEKRKTGEKKRETGGGGGDPVYSEVLVRMDGNEGLTS